MLVLATLSCLLACLHLVRLLTFMRALRRLPAKESDTLPKITVLVAARNEAEQLPSLLDCLAAQDYPTDLFSVLIIDDRSTDGSAAVVEARDDVPGLQCLSVSSTPDGWGPKKWAILQGIRAADTDIVLLTDADCRPESRWISGMVAAFRDDIDLVCGLSPLDDGNSALSRYAAHESWKTALSYTGSAARGRAYMAVGRNWGFRRSVFDAADGYGEDGRIPSGDDDLLFQRLVKRGARPGLCLAPGSLCPCASPPDLTSYIRQKLRHYRVGTRYPFSVTLDLLSQWAAAVASLGIWVLSLAQGDVMLRLICFLFLYASLAGTVAATDSLRRLTGAHEREGALWRAQFREGIHLVVAPLLAILAPLGKTKWK